MFENFLGLGGGLFVAMFLGSLITGSFVPLLVCAGVLWAVGRMAGGK